MSSSLLGTTLSGRYRLDARVGSGGMSTVYRAVDSTLERTVAIKLMNREIAADSGQLARFRREARAVAQLSHPHVVGVLDVGEDGGRPYIVFEFVEGETLKQRIRRLGELPVPEAVAYAIEIGRALGAAHARHIVHRDVKPQNVMIDAEATAKVTDFGIARMLKEDGLTADGRVLGTTDYVSPEQALGHDVTGQSDIYSLGIVLFEMLTGDVPFHGENQVAVAMRHVREPLPDVRVKRPEVSVALATIVDRATAKDTRERYATVGELIADLEEALALEAARAGTATGEATSVLRTLPRRARRRVPLRLLNPGLIVALLVLVGIGVALAVLLASQSAHLGTGVPHVPAAPAGLQAVSLAQDSAHDFDPLGDNHSEHPDQTAQAVDRDPTTYWSTEQYNGGNLDKAGVGLYVDAQPSAVGGELDVSTPTPGFTATAYGAPAGTPPGGAPETDPRWVRLAGPQTTTAKTAFKFEANKTAYRYYLIWITALPKGAEAASISEVALLAHG